MVLSLSGGNPSAGPSPSPLPTREPSPATACYRMEGKALRSPVPTALSQALDFLLVILETADLEVRVVARVVAGCEKSVGLQRDANSVQSKVGDIKSLQV